MCKSCQYCLETCYWNCCEERFCWDASIAEYKEWEGTGGSDDSLPVTRQPAPSCNNNNHSSFDYQDRHREVMLEVPILAPNIYQVFSKSMIFKDDPEFKTLELEDSLLNFNNNKTNTLNHAPVGKVVTFKDEKDKEKEEEEDDEPKPEEKPITDFEIMFQDELYKIDEEDEEKPKSPETMDEFISMKVDEQTIPKSPEDKPSATVTPIKTPENLAQKVILREDSTKSLLMRTPEMKRQLPRAKSALHLPRTDSFKNITRNSSRQDLIKRVDSAKNLKTILARLPERSSSFLSVPETIDPLEPNKVRIDEVFTISSQDLEGHPSGEYSLSRIPETPVITGHLPKFFAEAPAISEYKADTRFQNVNKTPDVIFTEFDYSMPRYYHMNISNLAKEPGVHTSKSMPDLNEDVTDKVSKRLVKIRSKLKPLVIKKKDHEQTRHSHQELQKY